MPGHGDWEQGEPKIMVLDGPCKNTMNPTEEATFTFLRKFLTEVTEVFPDPYLSYHPTTTPAVCSITCYTHSNWLTCLTILDTVPVGSDCDIRVSCVQQCFCTQPASTYLTILQVDQYGTGLTRLRLCMW